MPGEIADLSRTANLERIRVCRDANGYNRFRRAIPQSSVVAEGIAAFLVPGAIGVFRALEDHHHPVAPRPARKAFAATLAISPRIGDRAAVLERDDDADRAVVAGAAFEVGAPQRRAGAPAPRDGSLSHGWWRTDGTAQPV